MIFSSISRLLPGGGWRETERREFDSGLGRIVRGFLARDRAGHGLLVDSGDEVGHVLAP